MIDARRIIFRINTMRLPRIFTTFCRQPSACGLRPVGVLCLILNSQFFILNFATGQMAVSDAPLTAATQANHVSVLAQWSQQIQQATAAVQQLNSVVSNLGNIQGLIGTGLQGIGIDPSILSAVDLGKSMMNFGNAIQSLQQNAMSQGGSMESQLNNMRSGISDPRTWERYVINARSYDATQTSQQNYDTQRKTLDQQRQRAEAALQSAGSMIATQKAQAAIDAIHAAQKQLDEERKRAMEQQQANWISTQNQKDAWEQQNRDWENREVDVGRQNLDSLEKAALNQ